MPTDTRVGPYRILRLINRGGQGSVYLGYDKRLHRRVAIKIYSLPAQRSARRRLLAEAQLVASIESPKVVQVHDVIESRAHIALVMEYVPGCDLEEFLAAQRPSLASVLTVGADIAGALAAARQQHIVHGDLKAKNVLISDRGRVKLTDFGVARHTLDEVPGQPAPGSLSSLSPEQYLGRPLDVRSDLFALGCLLYRMLSGRQPFFRGGRLDADLLLNGPPQPVREFVPVDLALPDSLAQLVTDLLQPDPRDRPENTHRVRQVLRRLARDIPLAASDSLLQQARGCFRAESVDDIPPPVPADLGRDGRSVLEGIAVSGGPVMRRLTARRWRARTVVIGAALPLALVMALAIAVVIVLGRGQTRVHIEQPLLQVTTDRDLPREISGRWLVDEVKIAVAGQLGEIQVSGPVGATHRHTLYVGDHPDAPAAAPDEALQIELRCVRELCVFAVMRERDGARRNEQAVLFPDMPLNRWSEIVRSTTAALYR